MSGEVDFFNLDEGIEAPELNREKSKDRLSYESKARKLLQRGH